MRRGFTLIELLITLAILTAVATAGFIGLSRYKGGRDVELTMDEVVSVIRDVQKRSITEQDGKQWGIRFSNASSSYEVFSGASYSTSTVDRLYSLGRNIIFGNPSTSTLDTIFSAISGKLSENRIISLVNKRKDGLVGDITLLSRGTIINRLENGVVGYWHLDEATSTKAYDSSGRTNTGTLTNSPTWQSASNCKAGACLSFDGTDDYVSISDSSSLATTQAVTVAGWVKINSWAAGKPIFNRRTGANVGGVTLELSGINGVRFYIYISGGWQNAYSGDSSVTTGSWYHVVGTYDGSSIKIYLNGVLKATTAFSGTINNPSVPSVEIGRNINNTLNVLNGTIDEVRIYNRALSATEISNLYNDLK